VVYSLRFEFVLFVKKRIYLSIKYQIIGRLSQNMCDAFITYPGSSKSMCL